VPLTRRSLLGVVAAGTAGCVAPGDHTAAPLSLPPGAAARIGFAGDLMLGRGVNETWQDGPPGGVWGSLLDRLDALDGLVANLECTVSDRGSPQPGRTYRFRADPEWAIPALERGGVASLALANNHQLDFGPAALVDSVERLDDAGFAAAGAGSDRAAATRSASATVGGLDLALVSVTDQGQGTGAGPDRAGVTHLPLSTAVPKSRTLLRTLVESARSRDPDLVVVSLHWGPNWRERPSGGRRRLARWLIDHGADVVHGHSAHVVQGVETYRGRPILYDTGDLVDDYVVKSELRNDRSALFELVVAEGDLAGIRIVPVEIRNETAHRADETVAAWIRDRLRERSRGFETSFRRAGDGLWVPLSADRPRGDGPTRRV